MILCIYIVSTERRLHAKKLTRHGNSLALIIDKPLLRLLNISEKTALELIVEDGALIVRPVKRRNKKSRVDTKRIAEEIMDEYADVL